MVELKNIHFQYKKKKPLFTGINLQLTPGNIYGLLGRNGAGKTSLLKHISGLLFPQQGECQINGIKASERHPSVMEDVFVIPEEFELPPVSIDRYMRITSVFYSRFNKQQFDAYMAEFELNVEDKLSGLSYGQKKKFLIAFGLATNARIMILDEPTNGLDIPSKSQFRKIMASALDEERLIIISTHQVRDLENLIDTVLVLEKGQIIFNHNITTISEKLRFEQNLNGVLPEDILYIEELGRRETGIIKNTSGFESKVDLEILFNGIVKNSEVINAQLTKQTDYAI